MEATITAIKRNPLLGRSEAEVEIEHEGESTPSEEDVKSRLAAEEDWKSEEIEVKSIYTGYGRQKSLATLKIFQEIDEEKYEDLMEEQTTETADSKTDTQPETDADYEEIVSGTISDAKDQLKDLENPDYEAALEAEKDNKNRKTLVEWLEAQ